MLTYKQIKQFIEKNDIKFEINPFYFFIGEERQIVGYEIGMENIAKRKGASEWQWTWFKCFCEENELNDDTDFFFKCRFSMNSGKSYKGMNEAFKAMAIIEK